VNIEAFSIPEHWYAIAASALALPNKQQTKTSRLEVRGCLRKRAPENSSAQGTTQKKHMKQMSQSISNSTKSLPGRLTKVTTLGCILALVFLGATSAQPKPSGTARPFKANGIALPLPGEALEVVGTATHLGKFDFTANWVFDPVKSILYVTSSFTAANGDTLQAVFPEWAVDSSGVPSNSGVANITGGTGRFANASGSFVLTFSGADLTTADMEGTISY
jgi:hypothetical protein